MTDFFAAQRPDRNIRNTNKLTDPEMQQTLPSMPMTKEERERLWSERIEITIGGVELYSSLIDTPKGKNVEILHDSVFKEEYPDEHEWMRNITAMLNELSGFIINGMDDEAKERVSQMVTGDNGRSRLLYSIVMTRRLAGTGKEMLSVFDYLDSDFRQADPEVVARAAAVRRVVEKEMIGRK